MNNDEKTSEEIVKSMLDENQPMICGDVNSIFDDTGDRGGARSMVALITGKDIIGDLRKGMKDWRESEK
tara:strand:+ start:385 stop:591 length:207 start_codon:yes stop_codon:yes gene_type:complete